MEAPFRDSRGILYGWTVEWVEVIAAGASTGLLPEGVLGDGPADFIATLELLGSPPLYSLRANFAWTAHATHRTRITGEGVGLTFGVGMSSGSSGHLAEVTASHADVYIFYATYVDDAGVAVSRSSIASTSLGVAGVPAVPAGLFATASTVNSSVSIAWDPSTGADSYQWRRRVGSGGWTTGDVGGSTIYHEIQTTVGTRYEFQVRATNVLGSSDWSSSVYITALAPSAVPEVPAGLFATASTVNAGDVSIAWSAVSGATSYQYRRRVGSGSWTTVDRGTNLIAHYAGTAGTRYEFQVRATNAVGSSAWSSSVYITALAGVAVPAVPTGLFATSSTVNTSVSIGWTAVTGATSYQWRRRVSSGSWSQGDTGTTLAYHYTGTTVGTRYEFQVRATNAAGSSAWSSSVYVTATAVGSLPAVPTGLFATASTVNAGDVSIAWTAVSGATSYQYRRRIGSGSWTTVDRGARTIAHYAGTVGVQYEFQVRATNAVGSSSWSSSIYITALAAVTIPAVPTGLFATASTTNSSVSIAWNAVTGATGYQWRQRTGVNWTVGRTQTATIYHETQTSVGSRYEFQVRAVSIAGSSAWSSSVYITALAPSG